MIGMNRETGARLSGVDHLVQSIGDLLSTPIGSRVMRRDYGSALFELLDQPMNALGKLRLFAAVADAIRRWEPRIRLTRVALAASSAELRAGGAFALDLEGELTDAAGPTGLTRFTIPLRPATS